MALAVNRKRGGLFIMALAINRDKGGLFIIALAVNIEEEDSSSWF